MYSVDLALEQKKKINYYLKKYEFNKKNYNYIDFFLSHDLSLF